MRSCVAQAWNVRSAVSSCFISHTAGSSVRNAGAGSTPSVLPSPLNRVAWVSVVQVEDEVELCTAGPGLQLHRAAAARIGPCSAGDRKHAVLRVVERALDRDLAAVEERRPHALPGLADHAHAEALIVSDLRLVALVEDVVCEGQDVADHRACSPWGVRDR